MQGELSGTVKCLQDFIFHSFSFTTFSSIQDSGLCTVVWRHPAYPHLEQVTIFLKGHIDKQCRITDHLESAISLTCMSLGCGKKPEYLEGTHEETRRTCKHHKGRGESNPWPSCCEAGDSANHCVTSGLKVADVFDLSVLKISKCGWFDPIGIWTFILGGNSCTLHQSAFTLFQSRVQSLLLLIQLNVIKAMILFP